MVAARTAGQHVPADPAVQLVDTGAAEDHIVATESIEPIRFSPAETASLPANSAAPKFTPQQARVSDRQPDHLPVEGLIVRRAGDGARTRVVADRLDGGDVRIGHAEPPDVERFVPGAVVLVGSEFVKCPDVLVRCG